MTSTTGSDTPATPADRPTTGETADTRPEWTGRHRAEAQPAQAGRAQTPEADGATQDEATAASEMSRATTREPAAGSDTMPGQTSTDGGEIGGDGKTSRAATSGLEASSDTQPTPAFADGGGHDMSPESAGEQVGEADEDADGAGRQASIRQRWAVIADLHEAGVATSDIAERVGITPGAVDLILQAHRRNRVTLRD